MTPLEVVTHTLVGSRGGLGLLAIMGLIACLCSRRSRTPIGRWRRWLFIGFSVSIIIFQVPRLAWLLGNPPELLARGLDLCAVLLIATVMIGAIAVFAIERGEGVDRVRRGIVVNVFVFAAMVCVGWAYR